MDHRVRWTTGEAPRRRSGPASLRPAEWARTAHHSAWHDEGGCCARRGSFRHQEQSEVEVRWLWGCDDHLSAADDSMDGRKARDSLERGHGHSDLLAGSGATVAAGTRTGSRLASISIRHRYGNGRTDRDSHAAWVAQRWRDPVLSGFARFACFARTLAMALRCLRLTTPRGGRGRAPRLTEASGKSCATRSWRLAPADTCSAREAGSSAASCD